MTREEVLRAAYDEICACLDKGLDYDKSVQDVTVKYNLTEAELVEIECHFDGDFG